jgi:hypothetical protein
LFLLKYIKLEGKKAEEDGDNEQPAPGTTEEVNGQQRYDSKLLTNASSMLSFNIIRERIEKISMPSELLCSMIESGMRDR